jgi:hypothetical protein
MSMFDQLRSQASGLDLSAIGAQVGLTPQQVETGAAALLPKIADPAVDNREATAKVAEDTGIPHSKLAALIPVLLQHASASGATGGVIGTLLSSLGAGGANGVQGGNLGKLAGLLNRDGDGNPENDILGMFGRN